MNLPSKPTLRLFEFQAKDYFGLSIKDTSLVAVQASTSNHQLKNFSSLNLLPGVVQNGEIKNQQAFLNSLKSLLQAAQIKTPFVVFNVPETKVFGKIIEIPDLPDEELEEAISWQAEDQIPLEKSKIYYDFKTLEKDKQKTKIYLLASPQKSIDNLTSVIQQADLIPVAIESSALALTRFIDPKIPNPVLIIEVETPYTILSVAYKGTILISSSFETPANDTTLFENESSKEILQLREFCQKKFKTDFNSILSFGDLPIKLSQKTLSALNLKTIFPLLNLKAPPSQFINRFSSFALSFSLALKKATPPSDLDSINLLPPKLQGRYDLKEKQQFLSKICFFALSFLITITFFLASTFAYLFLNLKKLELEINTKSTQGQNSESFLVQKAAKEINSRSNQIIALSTQLSKTSSDLTSLNELVPNNLNILSISFDYDKNEFSLTGLAPQREDSIKLTDNIKNSKIFTNPQIPLKSLEKKENVEFKITFQKILKP